MRHKNVLLITFLLLHTTNAIASDRQELEMLEKSKINLHQAISLAEKHSGGKALSASIEDDSHTPMFEVNVAKDGKFYEVNIDGAKGEVLSMREDSDD